MDSVSLKKQVALCAAEEIKGYSIIGMGTGSTVNLLIEALIPYRHHFDGVIASSVATEKKLKKHGFYVIGLEDVTSIPIYVDGADEVNANRQMIKGGGGALTREKILAHAADNFLCVVDKTKVVEQLGAFPIAIEVLAFARSYVAREIVKFGGEPMYREGFVTDNHNLILDVTHLPLTKLNFEVQLNQIPGVVENGLFLNRSANKVMVAEEAGIYEL